MKLGKLVKRLKREALASPKKAAVLGLMGLVALYFWAPLVGKWFSKPSPAGAVAAAPPAQAAGASGAATPVAEATLGWRELIRQITADPHTVPVALALDRDPFAPPLVEVIAEKPGPVEPVKPPIAVTPASLGLSLVATMIAPDYRAARLNGKTVAVGQTIEVVKSGSAYQFTLAEVDATRAVLVRDGERFELFAKGPPRSGKIEIAPHD